MDNIIFIIIVGLSIFSNLFLGIIFYKREEKNRKILTELNKIDILMEKALTELYRLVLENDIFNKDHIIIIYKSLLKINERK